MTATEEELLDQWCYYKEKCLADDFSGVEELVIPIYFNANYQTHPTFLWSQALASDNQSFLNTINLKYNCLMTENLDVVDCIANNTTVSNLAEHFTNNVEFPCISAEEKEQLIADAMLAACDCDRFDCTYEASFVEALDGNETIEIVNSQISASSQDAINCLYSQNIICTPIDGINTVFPFVNLPETREDGFNARVGISNIPYSFFINNKPFRIDVNNIFLQADIEGLNDCSVTTSLSQVMHHIINNLPASVNMIIMNTNFTNLSDDEINEWLGVQVYTSLRELSNQFAADQGCSDIINTQLTGDSDFYELIYDMQFFNYATICP